MKCQPCFRILLGIWFCLAWMSATAGGWGPTFAIRVNGDGFGEPLLITDEQVLEGLSFWVGPGSGSRRHGHPYVASHVDPQTKHATIVDWERGVVEDKPDGLQRVEVRFLVGSPDQPAAFIVGYELDPANSAGYVYYPRSNYIVTHGNEGNWYYASKNWNEMIGSRVLENSFTGVPGEFTCSSSQRRSERETKPAGTCWPSREVTWPP